MSMKNALDLFFDPNNGDQDSFARKLGWEDAAQMCYYEDMAECEEQNQLPPPPPMIYVHELDKVDAREVYEFSGLPTIDDTDWSGVY